MLWFLKNKDTYTLLTRQTATVHNKEKYRIIQTRTARKN
ncbi:hypothetical protein I33_1023 [Bacillus subtilis subsp. subtilis str. RO-NN-1]|nr:hypothetical protein I33_1023 [Bacillus subtilis subsp. subtilis str. RO-NN-1]